MTLFRSACLTLSFVPFAFFRACIGAEEAMLGFLLAEGNSVYFLLLPVDDLPGAAAGNINDPVKLKPPAEKTLLTLKPFGFLPVASSTSKKVSPLPTPLESQLLFFLKRTTVYCSWERLLSLEF